MPLETITIASVEQAKTQRGKNVGSPYLIIHDAQDRKFFCFDQKLFPLLTHARSVGVDIQTSQDGSSLRIVNAAEQVGSNGHAASMATPNDTRDVNIRRQVALKAAVDAAGQYPIDTDMALYLTTVKTLADAFVAWLELASDDGADPW